ncbi:MAG: hypothetical protein Q4G04_06425, partial [bacterium]|nr:hypothetical protein [bacterium]
TVEDLINQVAYDNYLKDYNKKITIKKLKLKIIKNIFTGNTYKNKMLKVLDRLGYEQDVVAQKFYEMLSDEYEKNE